jgi:hypothetical protein
MMESSANCLQDWSNDSVHRGAAIKDTPHASLPWIARADLQTKAQALNSS